MDNDLKTRLIEFLNLAASSFREPYKVRQEAAKLLPELETVDAHGHCIYKK